jgi:hypothetical protein
VGHELAAQQTPSTQKPEAQLAAVAVEQGAPLGRGMLLGEYVQISCGP